MQLSQTEALEKPQWSGCSRAQGGIGHDWHVTTTITVTPVRAGLMLDHVEGPQNVFFCLIRRVDVRVRHSVSV